MHATYTIFLVVQQAVGVLLKLLARRNCLPSMIYGDLTLINIKMLSCFSVEPSSDPLANVIGELLEQSPERRFWRKTATLKATDKCPNHKPFLGRPVAPTRALLPAPEVGTRSADMMLCHLVRCELRSLMITRPHVPPGMTGPNLKNLKSK